MILTPPREQIHQYTFARHQPQDLALGSCQVRHRASVGAAMTLTRAICAVLFLLTLCPPDPLANSVNTSCHQQGEQGTTSPRLEGLLRGLLPVT